MSSRHLVNIISRPLHASSRDRARVISSTALHWAGNDSRASYKNLYVSKYGEQLARKAKKEGYESIEALRKDKVAQAKKQNIPLNPIAESAQSKKSNVSPLGPASTRPKSSLKSLNEIMDLEKISEKSTDAVKTLWTGYHQSKEKLSSVIPVDTYNRMIRHAAKYPQFVLPVERPTLGREMYFLQWSLISHELTQSRSDLPSPSTLLYTPLGQYQLHQDFAQPFLALTHYTDLAESHGIVLMRGDITPDVQLEANKAQLLVVQTSLFYGAQEGDEKVKVLRDFHERPGAFDITRLMELTIV